MGKLSKFERWIRVYGKKELAHNLRVTRRAVDLWLQGVGTPRVITMERICFLSEGKISFKDIVSHFNGKNKGK